MNADDVAPLPPPPPPAPPEPAPPPPPIDYSAESKALREYLAEHKKAEDAIREAQDPALDAVRGACVAERAGHA